MLAFCILLIKVRMEILGSHKLPTEPSHGTQPYCLASASFPDFLSSRCSCFLTTLLLFFTSLPAWHQQVSSQLLNYSAFHTEEC